MKPRRVCRILWVARTILLFSAAAILAQDQPSNEVANTYAIRLKLQSLKGPELLEYLRQLQRQLHALTFTVAELDLLIADVERIERLDPYTEMRRPPKSNEPPRLFWPNRRGAAWVRERLEVERLMVPIRALPPRERVNQIVEGVENGSPRELWFRVRVADEFVRAGPDAVPCMIKQGHRIRVWTDIIRALGEIGDERGLDFLESALRERKEQHYSLRLDAVNSLAKFPGDRVTQALIEALDDPEPTKVDKCAPQQPRAHVQCLAEFFPVRVAAAGALIDRTQKDWGWLFNEDRATWRAWWEQGRPVSFDPLDVPRSDDAKRSLVRDLFDRFLSHRPNPWQPSNDLAREATVAGLAQQLLALHDDVVAWLVQDCKRQAVESPWAEESLHTWTKDLLTNMGTPKALTAIQQLAQ